MRYGASTDRAGFFAVLDADGDGRIDQRAVPQRYLERRGCPAVVGSAGDFGEPGAVVA